MTKAVTQEELEFYEKNGYLLKKGLITPKLIQQICEEIEGLHDRVAANPAPGVHVSWEVYEDPTKANLKRIKQLMHSELVSPTINRIIRSEEMLDVLEALTGTPNISLYHSKLLMKAAKDGTTIPWHQDYAYWKREDNKPWMVNCQFSIDPATKENGCIQFVPGSHKMGLQEHERKSQTFGVFLPGHFYEREDAVLVETEPGDCIFFGPIIIHGSGPNTSDKDRRMNTIAYNVTGNGPSQCREVLRGKPL